MSKTSTIPLSKGFDIDKVSFPCYISEKYDGMPIKVTMNRVKNGSDDITYLSRQGTQNVSVKEDAMSLAAITRDFRKHGVTSMLAEVTHKSVTGFKNISGTIRRKEHNSGFIWNFFDFYQGDHDEFYVRQQQLEDIFYFALQDSEKFRMVKQIKHADKASLEKFLVDTPIRPDQEGWVIRSHNDLWVPNSRSWGYQKIVVTPSEDLELVVVDEAVSADGVPLGMAGKLWANYNGKLIGVGPGKLTHPERIQLWKDWLEGSTHWPNPMMEVTYKKDDTYTALREARFTCWRPDKD